LIKFNGLLFKLLLTLLVAKKNFPGVTQEFLVGFRTWLNDESNWQWLLQKRNDWEKNKPLEDIEDPMDRLM